MIIHFKIKDIKKKCIHKNKLTNYKSILKYIRINILNKINKT